METILRFNFVAKKLYRRLLQLGAQAILELGLGDDQATYGVEEAWNSWQQRLWVEIEKFFPPDPLHRMAEGSLLNPSYKIEILADAYDNDLGKLSINGRVNHVYEIASSLPVDYGRHKPYLASIVKNQRLTAAGHFQDVRHIELDISNSGFQYEPGDVVYIMPRNLREDVEMFLRQMGLLELADKPIKLESMEHHKSK
jgi:sulfite reductase alpha subunit-like flavoprotein